MRQPVPDRSVCCRGVALAREADQLGSEASQATFALPAVRLTAPPAALWQGSPLFSCFMRPIRRRRWPEPDRLRTTAAHGDPCGPLRTTGDGRKPGQGSGEPSQKRPTTQPLSARHGAADRERQPKQLGMQDAAGMAVSRWLPASSPTRRS
jgi:hypothetical protein